MLNVWYLADAHGALEVDAPVGAPLLRQEPQDRLVVLLNHTHAFRVQDMGRGCKITRTSCEVRKRPSAPPCS
jgi:hypothetical protein